MTKSMILRSQTKILSLVWYSLMLAEKKFPGRWNCGNMSTRKTTANFVDLKKRIHSQRISLVHYEKIQTLKSFDRAWVFFVEIV